MTLAHEFHILSNGKYVGMLFGYRTDDGLRWTHSIANHGSPMLDSTTAATTDFWETKARLPAEVHRVIFGN